MKNKVLTIIIILLLALTGALLWYAFTQQPTEDETPDVFNEEATVDNTEGMEFNTLPATGSTESPDVESSDESEVPALLDTLSPEPAESGPSFAPGAGPAL